ncbi:MAG: hypothetical protein WBE34_06420 [Candidatus Nitrosopolaris sp.]
MIHSHRMHLVHAPHRWYSLEEEEHGVNQLRVIGGVCDCCLKAGMQFYGGVDSVSVNAQSYSSSSSLESLGISMHPVKNIEIAELIKVVENAHRYLQIAFAEDLYLYCQASSINFPGLRDALIAKWNVNILEPRDGIGGHCLPKDTKMFLRSSNLSKSKILIATMDVDQDYKRFRTKPEKQIESATIEHVGIPKSRRL